MKTKLIILLFFVLGFYVALAQKSDNYVVITFDVKQRGIDPSNECYYWIVPCDSIKEKKIKLVPLFTEGYSLNLYMQCINGDSINPYLFCENENFDFSQEYLNEVETLKDILLNNRIKIQTIKKKWNIRKYTREITVYASPIIGNFCFCPFWAFEYIDYKGIIGLPISDFSNAENFWSSPNAKYIKTADFSFFFFINNSNRSIKDRPFWTPN